MIAPDTGLLFFGVAEDRPEHRGTKAWLDGLAGSSDVLICELVLAGLYRLLRNPVVLASPLSPSEAVAVVQAWRQHPRWRIAGFPPDSQRLHDQLWQIAARPGFAYRRLFDARLALTLLQHGVTEFATANVRDFEGFGFARVWNPLTS